MHTQANNTYAEAAKRRAMVEVISANLAKGLKARSGVMVTALDGQRGLAQVVGQSTRVTFAYSVDGTITSIRTI